MRLADTTGLCYAARGTLTLRIQLSHESGGSVSSRAVIHAEQAKPKEVTMGKGNNSQKKETKKPKKEAPKKPAAGAKK